MTDCGHLALIASGEAHDLCPLCQRAEIERLTAVMLALKTPASRELLNITKGCLDNAEAEVERLRAAATEIDRYLLVIESAVRNADPSQHSMVLAALQANRAALEDKP